MITAAEQHRRIQRLAAPQPAVLGIVAVGLFASALVLYGLTRPHALFGVVQYDDGVYFDAAIRLVTGHLPYRDFTMVQPPGIAVLFAPVALIARHVGTRDGLAIARCVTAVVAGFNAYLAGRLLLHRGAAAAVLASSAVALFPAAVFADRTLLLEPYVVLFCLLGARRCFVDGEVATRRQIVLGGICFGVAITTKTWAVVIVASTCLAFLGGRSDASPDRFHRLKDCTALLGSTAAAAGLICLPFFVASPRAFFHDVIVVQLSRAAGATTPTWVRLADIVGIDGTGVTATPLLAFLVTGIVVAVLIVGGLIPALRRESQGLERFALIATALSTLALLVPSEYFSHYAYFVAPFLACSLASALIQLARFPRRPRTANGSPSSAVAIAMAFALVIAASGLTLGESRFDNALVASAGDPSLAIDLAIPAGSCAISDAMILLVEADRATSNASTCAPAVDATGVWLANAPQDPPLSCQAVDPLLVSTWQSYFKSADFFVESGSSTNRVPWTVGLRSWFKRTYRHVPDPGANIFVRLGTPFAATALDPAKWTAAKLLSEGWRPSPHHATTHRFTLPACLASRT